MKRLITFWASALLAASAFAITATKEYVDRKDVEKEEAAKAYADAATNDLDRALSAKIEAATPADYAEVKSKAESALQPDATNGLLRAEIDPMFSAFMSGGGTFGGFDADSNLVNGLDLLKFWIDWSQPFSLKEILGNFVDRRAQAGIQSVDSRIDANGGIYVPAWNMLFTGDGERRQDIEGLVSSRIADATNGLASVSSVVSDLAAKADAASVYTKAEADAAFYPADEGALWSSWWSGDGFRVSVSNYDVSASSDVMFDRLPAAAFEYRPGGTGELVRVWDERTRWERARASFAGFTNGLEAVLSEKAGIDWGRTTPTGFDAPEGFTWLDTPAVAVAGGLAWQKTVTGEGAVWLLCSNGMLAEFGTEAAATNGYFRITDERGETAFEIVNGKRRTVGANAAGCSTWTAADGKTRLRVIYNVVSDSAPKLYVATEMKPGGGTVWHEEGAEGCPAAFAGWTGSSGAWTNEIWRASASSAGASGALFCYATYEQGGKTYVKNHAPVEMSKIVLGGVTYALGTATIDGKKVLTLTEAP